MKQSNSAGGIVVGPDDLILVVNQNGNSWSLPKGTLEGDEDEITAAKREIAEESGVKKLNYIEELGTYKRFMIGFNGGEDPSHLKTITIFLFTTSQNDLKPNDPHNPEARWVAPDEVANLLTHTKDKQFFQSVLPKVKEFIAQSS